MLDRALRAAARAPSAHNTQPWLVTVDGGRVTVTVDPDRLLPIADPRHHDLLLGLGCWVESFVIASGARLESVTGTAPHVTLTLRIDAPPSPATAAPSAFTIADLEHRQVDRGRLRADPSALLTVLTDLPDEVVVEDIPEPVWRRLAPTAQLHLASTPAMLRETLSWLRLDPADPRYVEDGLTAECLRIPRLLGVAAHRLLASRPGRFLIGISHRWHRLARLLARLLPAGRNAPTRVVFGMTPAPADEAGWIDAGRHLMRLWLALDRAGLRVAVASEFKDEPGCTFTLTEIAGTTPCAVFSVGRSTGDVPRSHRISPADA